MCIICYSPAGTVLSEEDLFNSNSNNPDGFGWAVRTPNGIVTGKTMNSDQAIDQFLDLRGRFADFDAVYHARITTHGATMLENNHPFIVGDERTVLVHNGMLPITPSKGDKRSDTRIFAEERLPSMGVRVLDKPKSRRKLEKWMQGSKMVIMSTRSDLRKDTYILNEDSGVWDNGIWYSNATYSYPGRWLWSSGADSDLDLGVECLNPMCGVVWDSLSDSVNYGICDRCNCCLDCGEGWLECLCYDPLRNSELEYRYDSVSY